MCLKYTKLNLDRITESFFKWLSGMFSPIHIFTPQMLVSVYDAGSLKTFP